MKLELQPNPDQDTFDPNLIAAIKGGNAPDVAIGFTPSYAGQYCSSGLWEDLTPFMQKDHMSVSDFAPATLSYTKVSGKQCALPSLTDAYGLYYNTAMFKKAGISSPPQTMDELAADAKKLTVKNTDGSIKVAGFVPLNLWEELDIADIAHSFGAQWFDSSGKAQLATDPAWTQAFEWQKSLVDWYGYSNLQKFYATYTNSEFNPTNAFETGKVAMVFDGEWRTAFIRREHPTLAYATAPFPATDPSLYGSGRVGGTIVGIPEGTKHPQEAWDLVKFLATDTPYLVALANSLGNVPTTKASGDLAEPQPGAAVQDVRRRLEQPEVDVLSTAPARRRRLRPAGRRLRRQMAGWERRRTSSGPAAARHEHRQPDPAGGNAVAEHAPTRRRPPPSPGARRPSAGVRSGGSRCASTRRCSRSSRPGSSASRSSRRGRWCSACTTRSPTTTC